MSVPPGPPPRFLGLKITSNRIESVLIMFTFTCLSLILYGNNLIDAVKKRDEIAIESFNYMQKKTKGLSF